MNEVARIKYALDDQAFFGIFHTPEIKARRAARMREDAQRARRATYNQGYAQGEAHARREGERRERALIKAKDKEAASLAADVAGGLTMAATLVGIFMML